MTVDPLFMDLLRQLILEERGEGAVQGRLTGSWDSADRRCQKPRQVRVKQSRSLRALLSPASEEQLAVVLVQDHAMSDMPL